MNPYNNKTILLVEDDALIAMSTQMSLEEYGYNVINANTGEEAIEIFKNHSVIDLILMDIDLGDGIDGPTTAISILKEREIPVIFLSSHTEPEVVEKTEKITSYGYVVKNSGITILDASIKMAFKLFEANIKIVKNDTKQNAMISNISDVIGIIGTDAIIKYKSPNIEKWFGWEPKDLVDTDGWLTVHPDDLERIQNEFLALLEKDKSSVTVEYRYKCKNGSYKLIELTATNLTNDPIINGILMNYHDLTEHKLMKEGILNAKLLWEKTFDAISDIVCVISLDHTFLAINEAGINSLGIPKEQIIGKKCYELVHGTASPISQCPCDETLRSGKEASNEYEQNGRHYLLEAWTMYDNTGIITSFVHIIKDITEDKISKQSFKESESRLKSITENVPDFIFVCDSNGRISFINKVLPGFTNEQVLASTIFDFTPADQRTILEKALTIVFEKGETSEYESLGAGPGGSLRNYQVRVSPIFVDGQVNSAVFLARDITERKVTEEALKISELKLRTIVDNVEDPIFVKDNEHRLVFVNRSFCKIFGLEESDIIGKSLDENVPENERAHFLSVDRRVLDSGTSDVREEMLTVNNFTRTIVTRKSRYVDHNGNNFIFGSIHDITEHKRSEEVLRKNEEQLRGILSTAMDGFWLTDMEGRILEANDTYCSMTGFSREELLTMRIPDLEVIETADETSSHIRKIIELGEDRFETMHRCKDGSIIKVEVSAQYRPEDGGRIVTFVRDKSKFIQMENTIQKSEDRYRKFIETTREGFGEIDKAHRIIYVNKHLREMFGYTSDEMVGLHVVDDLVFPEDQESLKAHLARRGSGENSSYEHRFRRKDGKEIWVIVSGTPVMNESGDIQGSFAMMTDITDRKRTEESLLLSYNIVNNIRIGLHIYQLENFDDDRTLRMIFANQAAADMTGVPVKDVIGRTLDDNFPGLREKGIPQLYANVVRTGKGEALEEISYKDNRILESVYSVKVFPLPKNQVGVSFENVTDRKQTDESLQEKEVLLNAFLNHSNEYMGIFEALYEEHDLRYIRINKAAGEYISISPENIKGMLASQIGVTEETRKVWLEHCRKSESSGTTEKFIYKREVSGGLHVLEATLSMLKYPYFTFVIADITDHKRVEYELRESEERFRNIALCSENWIWEVDAQGLYTYVSPVVEQILGYRPEDVVGKMHFYDFFPSGIREEIKKQAFEAFITKTSFTKFINLNIHKNGTQVVLETSSFPILDSNGELLGYRGVDSDITERKKMEELLRESEVKFRTLFEQAGDYVLIIDPFSEPPLRILDVNDAACREHGYTREEMLAMTIWDIDQKLDPVKNSDIIKRLNQGENVVFESMHRRKDGTLFPVEVSTSLAKISGITRFVISIERNITERTIAGQKIQSLLEEKELILKEVHHRIKNNMSTVKSLLVLQAKTLKDPAAISSLNDAGNRIQSMMVLYDKLYMSNSFNEIPIKHYLSPLVEQIVANFPNSGSVRIEKHIGEFILDSKRLSALGIIVNELLTNIMKYAFKDRTDGIINISASLTGNLVSITVQDNGVGIPESINIENTTGFGLMLVGILAKQLKGTIRIERDNETRVILEFEK